MKTKEIMIQPNRVLTLKEKLDNIRLITDDINKHSLYP